VREKRKKKDKKRQKTTNVEKASENHHFINKAFLSSSPRAVSPSITYSVCFPRFQIRARAAAKRADARYRLITLPSTFVVCGTTRYTAENKRKKMNPRHPKMYNSTAKINA
jgi:hypothetical protein